MSVHLASGLLLSLFELVCQSIRVSNSYSCSYNLDLSLLCLSMQSTILFSIALSIKLHLVGQRNAIWEVMVIMGMFVLIFTVIANFLVSFVMLLLVQAIDKYCLSTFYIIIDYSTLGPGIFFMIVSLIYILINSYRKTRDWIRTRRARKELANLFKIIYNPNSASLEELLDKYQNLLNTEPLGNHEVAILRDYFGEKFSSDQSAISEEKIQSCTICFDSFHLLDEVISFPICQHRYHWKCLQNWLAMQLNCPLCKRNIRPSMIICIRENYQKYLKSRREKGVSMNQTVDLSLQHKTQES
jgi:Ring finger domain